MAGNLLLTNGTIYPGPPWQAPLSALAIRDGKVAARDAAAERLRGRFAGEEVLDLRGAVVLPGFVDSHLHLLQLGEALGQVTFHESAAPDIIRQQVADAVKNRQPGEWITGGQWSRDALGGLPSRALLDPVSPENPVALHSKDLHTLLLNTCALKELDITGDTPDPSGGLIPRDREGQPTGILREHAIRLFESRRPVPDDATFQRRYQLANRYCLRRGITTVHTIESLAGWDRLRAFAGQDSPGVRTGGLLLLQDVDRIIDRGYASGDGDDRRWIIGIKIFADGALGSRSAWLKEPYAGNGDRGMPLLSPGELTAAVERAHRHGLSVGIHAIGDAAVESAIEALAANRRPEYRDRIEHVQLIDPKDLSRISPGIVASVQPVHLPGDRKPAEKYWGDRARYAYAFRSLREHGMLLAFGSDAPVEDANPWAGIQAAVERRASPDQTAWYPEESVSLDDALTAYTENGGRAAYREDRIGGLRMGAHGDAVVLDRNPWEVPAGELGDIKPQITIVAGEIVHTHE